MSNIKGGAQFSERDSKGRTLITFLKNPDAIKAKKAELDKKAEAPKQEDVLNAKLAELKSKEAQLAELEAQAKLQAEREAKLKAIEADIAKREKALSTKEKTSK